jgi:hypothetical protein
MHGHTVQAPGMRAQQKSRVKVLHNFGALFDCYACGVHHAGD